MPDKLIQATQLSGTAQVMLCELSESERGLLSEPLLHTHLPINFKNGWRFDCLEVICSKCLIQVKHDRLFGRINRHSDSMCAVDAIGLCSHCHRFVVISYRFHDNGDISGCSPVDGRWTRWVARKSSWWSIFIAQLLKLNPFSIKK